MFYPEPLNPAVTIATLKNEAGDILYLRTRVSPPSHSIHFSIMLTDNYYGKPLYEVQKTCYITCINSVLEKYYPDYNYFTEEGN
jgi:hypothetical protein